jgi:hypothetical protein
MIPETSSGRKSWKTKKPQIPENEKQIDKTKKEGE